MQISFNHPGFVAKELLYIAEAIQREHTSGGGPFTAKCNLFFESQLHVQKSILTTSCTDALEMTALLLNIQPGDEVIVPSFTFVSSASAFTLRGAKIAFADVRPDTCNIDETKIEALINSKTKAIIVVHYAGVPCEMDAILSLAKKHSLVVIEDNAHGLFASYKGRPLGSLGSMATLSFHETKNFTCGEGGALLLNDNQYIERAEVLKDKGTNRKQFLSGQVDKYTWVDHGSSFLLADLLAAFLYAQLEQREKVQRLRENIWNRYFIGLQNSKFAENFELPTTNPHGQQAFHMFYLKMKTPEQRSAFIEWMKSQGIQCVFHYQSLHSSPMGRKVRASNNECPISDSLSTRLVRLPFYNELSEEQIDYIVKKTDQFFSSHSLPNF